MYNTDMPRRADLPTSARLKRSTAISGVVAALLLTTVVFPSEYGVDPTRIGRLLGLTQMGEIKTRLSVEAAMDAAATTPTPVAADPEILARLERIEKTLVEMTAMLPAITPAIPVPSPAVAPATTQPAPVAQAEPAPPAQPEWMDEVSFTLAPGEGAEFKLVMEAGSRAEFHWTANGSVVNYDTHGDGGGNAISYEKGRSVPEQEGVLEAAFTGNHGWFWRNKTSDPVTITLRTRGAYSEIKRML